MFVDISPGPLASPRLTHTLVEFSDAPTSRLQLCPPRLSIELKQSLSSLEMTSDHPPEPAVLWDPFPAMAPSCLQTSRWVTTIRSANWHQLFNT